MLDAEAWPIALLALRIATVVLLYLFLATAFRALRADLRADFRPARVQAPAREPVAAGRTVSLPPGTAAWEDERDDEEWDGVPAWEDGEWEDGRELEPAGLPAAPARLRPSEPGRRRLAMWLPIAGAVLVLGFGGGAFILAGGPPGAPPSDEVTPAEGTPADPTRPPAVVPAPGRVTVGLAATEDAQVRVTVDGVVEFDGTLRAGQRQAWEGSERIQVWTDSGRTVQLAVNGVDLGAYSPAMGHPDWNRIDFGFWPGWAQ